MEKRPIKEIIDAVIYTEDENGTLYKEEGLNNMYLRAPDGYEIVFLIIPKEKHS